jgi:hypothetical protein
MSFFSIEVIQRLPTGSSCLLIDRQLFAPFRAHPKLKKIGGIFTEISAVPS